MNYTKTYQSLQELNTGHVYGQGSAVKVDKCSALLPNHMQCWRAADVLITTETVVPATEAAEAAVSKSTVQMCNRHAALDQQEYLAEVAAVPVQEAATPASVPVTQPVKPVATVTTPTK